MVICGGNGCGKSALLEALMNAKEYAGEYGRFFFDSRAVSADSEKSIISMSLSFSEEERDFVKKLYNRDCPEQDEVLIEIAKGGGARVVKRSDTINKLFTFFSRELGSPGFFDYITAQRQTQKVNIQTWESGFLSDERAKSTLAVSQQKFQYTKQYLVGLKMKDLQTIQTSSRQGEPVIPDSLKEIRDIFDRFFAPLIFNDVYLDTSPFKFVVSTPLGEIDIDDMSSGEKEILNIFIRFHQLKPHGAVILFDEADAHLHPDLERRYLEELRELSRGNQLILTTHSPEMMIAAGSDALFTILKEPQASGKSQLLRVTENEHLYDVLSELMGSRGIVSFNQRIVFIEGENASADRAIYEAYYPPSKYNVSFVPAGDSSTIRRTAERINALLTASIGFQQYYSIVDRDIFRSEGDPTGGQRLFRLPVYHVENFLLNGDQIYDVTKSIMGVKCPYQNGNEVAQELEAMVLSVEHVKPFTNAIFDAKLGLLAKKAYDSIYKKEIFNSGEHSIPDFETTEKEARLMLQKSIHNGAWRADCKGRDLLKAYCGKNGIKYEHFRNILISRLKSPPLELSVIMEKILS
jgi:predicted ATPase